MNGALAKKRDFLFLLLLTLCLLLWVNSLFFAPSLGAGAALATILLFPLSLWYLSQGKRPPLFALLCSAEGILLAVATVFSKESFLQGLCLAASMGCFLLTVPYAARNAGRKPSGYRCLWDAFLSFFLHGVGYLPETKNALLKKEGEDGTPVNRRFTKVLLGLALALPVFVVILPLLILSDAAFEGLIQRLTPKSLGEIVATLLFGGAFALVLFSQHFFSLRIRTEEAKPPKEGKADGVILATFLGAIGAVYLLYLFSQSAYFFNAFAGLLPEDYSLSQYARRGFFEICALSAVNLLILVICLRLAKRKEGRLPLAVKAFAVYISLFSLFLISTALAKMLLYIDTMGLTRLRLYTSVFMVLLAVIFLCVIVKLFWKGFSYFPVILLASCLLLSGLCFANPDKLIADYNVDAYLQEKHEHLDLATLRELSPSATAEAYYRLYTQGDREIKESVQKLLNQTFLEYYYVIDGEAVFRQTDPRSLSFPEWQCQEFLKAHWKEFYSPRRS